MRNLMKNESGNIYTWFLLVVVVITISGIYLISSQVVDPVIDKHADLSDQGRLTEQNTDCFNFLIKFYVAFPIIIILGLAAWAVIETVRTKEGGY